SDNVTANYQITTVAGKLTISKKGVTDDDGNIVPATDPETGNPVDDEGNPLVKDPETGKYYPADPNDPTKPVEGSDPVEPKPVVTVEGTDPNNPPTYDGDDHKPTIVDNTTSPATPLEEGTDYTVEYFEMDPETGKPAIDPETGKPIPANPTDAGDKVAVITFIGDFDGEVTVPVSVVKRKVTLTSADGEKDFDGTPLTKNEQADVIVGGDGFVSGQGATYDITGTQTTAGSSENTFKYTLNEGTKASNYEIETVFGTLTVNPFSSDDNAGEPGSGKRIEVTPIAPDPAGGTNAQGGNTATYTGKPVERPVIVDSKTGETLEEGKDYKVTYYDENGNVVENPTNAGTYRVVVEFMGDYSGTYETTMTIDRAELRVSTPSASKTFDGSALTNRSGAKLDGLVNGETATLRVTGSQTNPGSSRNGYRIVWDGTALEANYVVVSETLGTLTVTEAPAAPAQVSAQEPPADEPAADEPAAPATSNIAEPSNPLAPAEPTGPTEPVQGAWALLNLLAALVTAAFCAFRLGGIRRGEKARNTRRALRLATIVPAIVGIVAFVLTEDMSQPMVMTDAWTPLMVAILAAQAVMTVLARTKDATSDDQQATA
ncbi:MAG: hypothetical protein IJI88_01980, partial [Atopobiaceae bacterium]|nr:hypothetical protein [Atopobiaceae bacterium]